METSFANLATPPTTISFSDLDKNVPYKILKFRIVYTQQYKDSAVVDILVNNQQKASFCRNVSWKWQRLFPN